MFLVNYVDYGPIFISISLTVQQIKGVIQNLRTWFFPIISTTVRDTAAKMKCDLKILQNKHHHRKERPRKRRGKPKILYNSGDSEFRAL
jgi:hypothetical protein